MKLAIVELLDYITMPGADAALRKDFENADKRGDEVWLTETLVVPWSGVRRAVFAALEAPTVRKVRK